MSSQADHRANVDFSSVTQASAVGTPFVKQKPQHTDRTVVMCPFFKLAPDEFNAWKAVADEFYKVVKQSEDLLFYNMAFCDGGVTVRQGYRTGAALLKHLRTADKPMTDALKVGKLEKVEVHGPKRQLRVVRKEMTQIGDCYFTFFEKHKEIKGTRRNTKYSGGNDNLISCNLAVSGTKQELKALEPKFKDLHRHCHDLPSNESVNITHNSQKTVYNITMEFSSSDCTVEQIAYIRACLGEQLFSAQKCKLHLSGADAMVKKVKSLIGMAGEALEADREAAKKLFQNTANRASNSVKVAKAQAAAAAKALETMGEAAMVECRTKMKEMIASLQDGVEEQCMEMYQAEMKLEGATKDAAHALAVGCYKRGVKVISTIRCAAEDACRETFEKAVASGKSIEQALEKAEAAASAAAQEAQDELLEAEEAAKEAAKAAAETVKKCGEEMMASAMAAAKAAAEEAKACEICVATGALACKAEASSAAKEVRRTVMGCLHKLQEVAEATARGIYEAEKNAELKTEEMIKCAAEQARGACWAVVSTSEQAYYLAYEKAMSIRKGVEDAEKEAEKEAAETVKAAEKKAVELWKGTEERASQTLKECEHLVQEEEKALVSVVTHTVTYVVTVETSIRHSIYKKELAVEEEIREEVSMACQYTSWAVTTVVDDVEETYDEAHKTVAGRIQSWYDAILAAEVEALRAIADAADCKADKIEKTGKPTTCC